MVAGCLGNNFAESPRIRTWLNRMVGSVLLILSISLVAAER